MSRFLFLCFTLLFSVSLFCAVASPAAAASRYWVGTTDGANTSSTANWSTAQGGCGVSGGASVPVSTDTAFFTSSCTNGATVDSAFLPGGVNIASGYTGTITQGSGIAITVGTAAWTQAGGTFTGSDGAISLSSGFSLTGGTFTSTSGTLSLTNGLTISGATFNHHNGQVSLTGTSNGSAIWSCGGTTFNGVSLNKTAGSTTIGSDCTLPITGTNPTVNVGTGGDTFTLNGTLNITGNINFVGTTFTLNTGGTLAQTGTSATFSRNLNLLGGTFPSGITTLTVGGTLDNTGNLLPNNIALTVNSNNTTTLTCGSATFASITINRTGNNFTPASDCTFGDFSILGGVVANPASPYTYTITGNFVQNVSNAAQFGGSNLTLLFSGSNNQTITQTNGNLSSLLQINKSGGSVQLLTDVSSFQTCSLLAGTFIINGKGIVCSTNLAVSSGATLQIIGSGFAIPTLSSGSIVKITGDGDSAADTYSLPKWSYGNLTVSMTDSADSLSVTDTLATNLVGYWKMDEGTGSTTDDSSTNNNVGTLTNATFSTTVPTTQYTDPYSASFDGAGDYIDPGSNVAIGQNKSAMAVGAWVQLGSNSGFRDIYGLSTGTSTSNDRLNMQLNGDELRCQARAGDAETTQVVQTVNANLAIGTWHYLTCNVDFANDSITAYVDGIEFPVTGTTPSFTATATSNTASLTSAIGIDEDKVGADFTGYIDDVRVYDRLLTKAEIGALTAGYDTTGISTLNVANSFTQTLGTFNAPTTMNVGGNWAHSGGTFNHNSGTVVLNGADQTISGNTTFNNLTKSVSTARTLTLTAGSLQTILGTVTFNGTSGNLLSLRSSSSGNQWSFDPQGTRTLSYLDVKDSNNTNATAITTTGNNITNSGNNTNWNFDVAAPSISLTAYTPDPGNDTTPLVTGTATDAAGVVTAVQFQMDSTAGSWTSCTADDGVFDEASEAFSCQVASALSEGSHTINVRATDNALPPNTTANGSVATDTFVIDTTAPGTPSSPSTTSPTNSSSQNWIWNAVSGAATYAWRITTSLGVAVDNGTTALTNYTSNLTQGAYIFYVKAIDAATNQGSESSGSVTVDTTTPSTPGTPSTSSPSDDTTPTWTWSSSTDSGGAGLAAAPYVVQWSQDSGFGSGISSSTSTTNSFTHATDLSAGTWYFRVKAQDAAGNESSYTSNGSITITTTAVTSPSDTTPPAAVELSTPDQSSYTNQDRPTFKWKTTTDNSSDISKYKLIVEYGFDANSSTGKTFSIDDIPASRTGKVETDKYVINYENFSDSDSTNNYISIYTKSSSQWGSDDNDGKLNNGKRLWNVIAFDGAGNNVTSTRELFVDRQNPTLSDVTFNGTAVTSALGTNSTQPIVAGTLTDSPGGEAVSKYVNSGPKSVEVKVEHKVFSGYETVLVTNFNLDNEPNYDCHGLTPADYHNNCAKSLPFSYKVSQPLIYGQYKMLVTGQDNAGNNSESSTILFTVTSGNNLAVAPAITPTPRTTIEPEPTAKPTTQPSAAQTPTTEEKQPEPEVTVPIKPSQPSAFEKLFSSIGSGFQSIGSSISSLFGSAGRSIADAANSLQNNSSGFFHVMITSTISGSQKLAQGTGSVFGAIGNGAKAGVTYTKHAIAQASFNLADSLTHGAGAASNSLSLAIVKFGYLFATEPTRISNVAIKINSSTSATITWETNHPATSKVNYGLDDSYTMDSQTDQRVLHHEITLTDLKPNTEYHFEVMSQNHNYVYDANRRFTTPSE